MISIYHHLSILHNLSHLSLITRDIRINVSKLKLNFILPINLINLNSSTTIESFNVKRFINVSPSIKNILVKVSWIDISNIL